MAASASQARVKEAVEKSLEKLELDQLRPLQVRLNNNLLCPVQVWIQKISDGAFTGYIYGFCCQFCLFLCLQAKSHLCAARCCENNTRSKDEVQHCLNQCFVPIHQAQEYVGKELNNFQVIFGPSKFCATPLTFHCENFVKIQSC